MANAVAGRVLLIPKGNYSADVTYNMLDLARHDNKSWVCKQTCTGQTPQGGDYWQLMASDGAEGGYCYIRYSVNADGTDFVAVPTEQTKYVGFYTGDSETAPTDKTLYAWSKYVGEDGTIGVDGVRGTRINQGTAITGVSTTPIPFPTGITDSLIGDEYQNTTTWNVYRCTTGGDAATALWIYVGNIKGADGLGSGDMLKSVYDTNNSGIVDMAEKLQTARTIELTGSVTGSAEFDGSGNVQINTTGGGASAWASIADKPFNTIGSNGLIVNTDVLDVDLLKIERKASTLTSKATVVLADEMVVVDSADSSITKRSPLSALKTKFDTLYNNYVLPTASASVKGGVKIGNGLVIDSEIVRVDKYTFANVAVATADFATYTATLTGEADLATAGYGYKAHIASTGVTADHEANVVFGAIEADSGNYASIATTEAGYVNIYAKAVPSGTITIPTIDCTYKGV